MYKRQGDIQAAVTLLQQYQQAVNEVEKNKKLDIDTADAQKKADKLLGQIAGLSDNTKKAIGIDVKLDEKGIAKGLKDKSINVKEKVEGGDKVDVYKRQSKYERLVRSSS